MASLPAHQCDVVVIGAGLAGLACARRLRELGVDCLVLEARDRVGGRTFSADIGGARFDLGAQWLGPTQTRMFALVKELGIATFPTYCRGKKILDLEGVVSRYRTPIPLISPRAMFEMARFLFKTVRRSRAIPLERPERARGASELDGRSLAAFQKESLSSPSTRALVDIAIRTIFGAESSDISLLYYLFYMRSGGGLINLIGIERAAQQTRFVDGAQAVALGLATSLGDRVLLDQPVRRLQCDDHGVTVETSSMTVRARRAVVAVPPALVASLDIEPELPAARRALHERIPMGITIKVHLIYKTAFWRADGLSGEVASTDGPATVVFDNCSHDGEVPALLAFLVGEPARKWALLPGEERTNALLAQLARYFGDSARHPVEIVEQNWADEPFTGGCPVGARAPGDMHQHVALGDPVGRLHFAGTETASVWCGYMEGAVRSGERAAAESAAAVRAGTRKPGSHQGE